MTLWKSTDIAPAADTVVTADITNLRTCTVADTTGLAKGDLVSGTGITAGTTIAQVNSSTVFTLSQDAVNGTGISITAKHLNTSRPKYESVANQQVIAGFDVAETAKTPVTHAGWVKVTTGSGGRAGRKQYETLVAMGSLAGTFADDALAPEPTVVISGLADLVDQVISTAFTLTATVVGTGLTGTLSYQWQSSPDGITYTNIAGKTTKVLTGTTAATPATTQYYRLNVKIGTKIIGSDDVTVTTAA